MRKRKRTWWKTVLQAFLVMSLLLTGIAPQTALASQEAQVQEGSQTVVYVDGVGSGTKDGSSAENALATLKEAYEKIPEGNLQTTIVICGAVKASQGAVVVKKAGTEQGYRFLPHDGKVIITSVYGEEDYRATASLDLEEKNYFLLGDTCLEMLHITKNAKWIFGNYFPLTLGDGLECDTILANMIYMGTSTMINGAGEGQVSVKVKDSVFTMKSGIVGTVYGAGMYWQGDSAIGKDASIKMSISGGWIQKALYGSGFGGTNASHHKSVEINVSGGTIKELNGIHGDATVYEDISINITGGTVTDLYGARKHIAAADDSAAYIPHVEGNITVTVGGNAVVSNLHAKEEGANVSGRIRMRYSGAENQTLGDITGFDALQLISSKVTVPAGKEAIWNSIATLQMTDDSFLSLASVPVSPAVKVGVEVVKMAENWNLATPLITAPAGTENIFEVISPLNYDFAYEESGEKVTWTLTESTLKIGQEGTPGSALVLDLGLPEDGSYTALPADATAYDTYLQKVEDLGDAKEEVNVIAPAPVQGQIELYVSPEGNDADKGDKEHPFKTVGRALSYVEALQNLDVKGVVIYLREGKYLVSDTVVLDQTISGRNGIPVMLSAYGEEKVTISGGIDIPGSAFGAVTDEAVKERLSATAQDKIVAVDLKTLGITEFGSIVYGSTGGPSYQIFVNGTEMIPARYPNYHNLWVGRVLDEGPIFMGNNAGTNLDSTGVEFEMQDFRPLTWVNDGNIWLKGSLYAEWDIKNFHVAEIREATKSIKLEGSAWYGARSAKSNTYYYYNILEELDMPGEYYLDRTNGILYLYPGVDMSSAVVTYSGLAKDLLSLNGTQNVVVNGITFEDSAGTAVSMKNCYQTMLQNCTFARVGTGVVINNGKKSGIIYSTIKETANRPVEILPDQEYFDYTPDLNFVQNCYIYNNGTKNPKFCAIFSKGTRNVISHNLIQGGFSVSIYLQFAKECIVEYNEIVGSPTGTYDCGAIYIPYAISDSGHHIRYNYIHDIGLFSDNWNPFGIYFDDGLSGNYAYGNVMSNLPGGFFGNCGSENVVADNVILDGRTGTIDAIRGEDAHASLSIAQRWARNPEDKETYEAYLALDESKKQEVRERYPLQAALYDRISAAYTTEKGVNTTGLFAARDNYVTRNVIADCKGIGMAGTGHVDLNNVILSENPFVNVPAHDFSLQETVDTSDWGFTYKTPAMDRMGIVDRKEAIGSFEQFLPMNGAGKVNPKEFQLQWTFAGGADTYEWSIAEDASMTQNLYSGTTVKNTAYFAEDEYFEFGKTYYWSVTAKSTAKSRVTTPVTTPATYSFTTMTWEEYVESNAVNLEALEETIAKADSLLAEMVEESQGGEYLDGSRQPLEETVAQAKKIVELGNMQMQSAVDAMDYALKEAITTAQTARRIHYITLDGLNADDWSDLVAGGGTAVVEGDELKMTTQSSRRTELIYGKEVGTRDILCFRFKLDKLSNWNGFALMHTYPAAFITDASQTSGYFICLNSGQIELQKRHNKKDYGNIAVVPNNNEILKGGEWYNIQAGAIRQADGSVRVLFKVNGQTVFDYLDTEEPITGSGSFGVVVQPEKTNGFARLQAADLDHMYTASLTAEENTAAVGDTVYVQVRADKEFASSELVLSYDAQKLTFDPDASSLEGAGYKAQDGTLKLADYGSIQNTAYRLAFRAASAGEAAISLTGAAFSTQEKAEAEDLIAANVEEGKATITIAADRYQVTLPDIFTGEDTVLDGEDYTFYSADSEHYDYSQVTASTGGESVQVTVNEDGSYTISNVKGDLVIEGARTPKKYNVTYRTTTGVENLPENGEATYGEDYRFDLPKEAHYTITVTEILIGGSPVTYAVDENGTVTVDGLLIEADMVITIDKTLKDHSVTVTGTGTGDVVFDREFTPAQDYVFQVNKDEAYEYTVKAFVNGVEVLLSVDGDSYTIAAADVKAGEILLQVEKTLKPGEISVQQYVQLDGPVMWLVKYKLAKPENRHYVYNQQSMFWSEKYQTYCTLVISKDMPQPQVKDFSLEAGAAAEVDYGMDVNRSGKVDANDAQLVYNMYNAMYRDFTDKVTLEKFLRADINGSGTLTVEDAAAIIDYCLGRN